MDEIKEIENKNLKIIEIKKDTILGYNNSSKVFSLFSSFFLVICSFLFLGFTYFELENAPATGIRIASMITPILIWCSLGNFFSNISLLTLKNKIKRIDLCYVLGFGLGGVSFFSTLLLYASFSPFFGYSYSILLGFFAFLNLFLIKKEAFLFYKNKKLLNKIESIEKEKEDLYNSILNNEKIIKSLYEKEEHTEIERYILSEFDRNYRSKLDIKAVLLEENHEYSTIKNL